MATLPLLTLGHGTLDEDALAELIRSAGIAQLIDIRTVPKSRVHPHVWSERMELWVPAKAGASYEWPPDLGGFRKTTAASPNTALRNANFRGYADYMQTAAFAAALERLVADAGNEQTAIMCSESVWWRCHRRLVSDAAVLLHGADVQHLMHDGKRRPHQLTEGVRKSGAILVYDA